MLEKGRYTVVVSLYGCDQDSFDQICAKEADIDIEDFLDIHHRGKLSVAIDELRDLMIRDIFRADLERTE